MKFLVLMKPLPGASRPENPIALIQEDKEWLNARLTDGSLDCAYNVIRSKQGIGGVANANSHEELVEQILGYPRYPFFDFEILPLSDVSHFLEKGVEMLQKFAGE